MPRTEQLTARRMVRGTGGTSTPVDDPEFSARLVRYADDGMSWIRIESSGGEPLEISIEDANRWIMLIGSAIVDEGIRER